MQKWLPAVIAMLMVACSGDSKTNQPPPISTALPTASAAPPATPIACALPQAVCAFALQIERELLAHNYDAIVKLARSSPIQCPGTPQQGPPALPICDGVTAGETRQGYSISRRYSEGAAVSQDAFRQAIVGFVNSLLAGASDVWGPSAAALYTIGCVEPDSAGVCGRFAYVFSGIVGPANQSHREVLIFFARQPAPGQAIEIVELRTGIVLANEEQALFRGGGGTIDLGQLYPRP